MRASFLSFIKWYFIHTMLVESAGAGLRGQIVERCCAAFSSLESKIDDFQIFFGHVGNSTLLLYYVQIVSLFA